MSSCTNRQVLDPNETSQGAAEAFNRLREWIEERRYAGYDPYDALNSPIARLASLHCKWGRVAVIQALKRCPVNVRPLLLLRPGVNPKALGLILEGYIRSWPTDPAASEKVDKIVDLLGSLRTPLRSGHGWGYNFDWQSRVFSVSRGIPNIVCSSFIGHALLDAWDAMSHQRALDLAVPLGEFFLSGLNRTADGEAFCFSYTPIDSYAVHNANLLGASLLIRLYGITGIEVYREAALCALRYSMKHQHQDGSWFYSERPGSHWIDSFHTGFNLEAIRHFIHTGHASEYKRSYALAFNYYATHFFTGDGTPKYFHDRVHPIDIHSAAEAIAVLSTESGYRHLAENVLSWTLSNMYDGCGQFYFQKHKFFTNRVLYVRWSQAWMFRALAAYLF